MKNLSTTRALKGAKTSELVIWNPSEGGWHPSEGVWHPSEGGTLYLWITVMESLMRSLASLRRRYTLFMYNLLIESLKRSLASYTSERGTLYLFMYNL